MLSTNPPDVFRGEKRVRIVTTLHGISLKRHPLGLCKSLDGFKLLTTVKATLITHCDVFFLLGHGDASFFGRALTAFHWM